jgi:hypothetical protein
MPNSRASALGTGRFAATAILAAVILCLGLPAIAAAAAGSTTSPGPMATLYAGSSPTYRPARVPVQGLHAQARQALVPTSTITVTYHGFAGQAQAKAAFQAAVDVWQSIVVSSQVIHVNAYWSNLGSTSGILGQARATSEQNGGDGFWYPVSLAEARCSCEKNGSQAEIYAQFNKAFPNWYKGTDGNVPLSKWDLETVVLHELGHGLGFYSSFSVNEGSGYRQSSHVLRFDANEWDSAAGGRPMTSYANASVALKKQLTDKTVFIDGPHLEAAIGKRAKLYAPGTWEPGSSNAHLDEDKYGPGTINALMTPYLYNGEAIHDPGPITTAILEDIGWSVAGES